MSRRTRIVLPFGFYGWGNIGDESTLQGFAQLLSPYRDRLRVWAASRNPTHTRRVEPRFRHYHAENVGLLARWVARRAHAHVVAGGTPIMDVLGAWPLSEVLPLAEQARDQGKPMVFVGAGTERLHREESRRLIAECLAPIVQRWSVRSDRDRDRLAEYGVTPDRIDVAADLAWLLEGASTEYGAESLRRLGLDFETAALVGVNLTNERFVAQQRPGIFAAIADALDRLIEMHGVRVLFLANEVREHETLDKAASEKVLKHMRHRHRATLVPNEYRTPAEMLSLIGCCRFTIGMRYHFCLFSALQHIPFIGLKRSDKVEDLCWDLQWPYGLGLTEVTADAIVELARDLETNRERITAELGERVECMRERAWRNRRVIDELLGPGAMAEVGGPALAAVRVPRA